MYIAISTIIFLIIIVSAILFYISVKSFYKKKINNIPVEYLQSMNYLLSEQHDKAIDTFMSMVSVNKDTAETHIILGNLFRNRGEVDRAIRIHQNLIARPELKPEIRQQCSIELARDYLKSGFLDRAELIFTRLSYEIENPVQVLHHLKEIYEQEKEWKKAIDIAERIQSITNEDMSDVISHYYCELAEDEIVLKNKENLDVAKKYTNKALGYNKKSLRALILLGDISFENKNFTDALKRYMNIFDSNPNFSYLVLDKVKKTYDNLGTKENFFSFVKSLSKIQTPMELYSNLSNVLPTNMSNKELSDLYDGEFQKGKASLTLLSDYINLIEQNKIAFDNKSLNNIKRCLNSHSNKESRHECVNCGFNSIRHFWQCPSCHQWSSISKSLLNKSKNDHYVV